MGTGWVPRWGAARGWTQELAQVQAGMVELWAPRDTAPDTLAGAQAWDRPGRALETLERRSQLSLEQKQHVALAAVKSRRQGRGRSRLRPSHHTGRGGHLQSPRS